MSRTYVYFVIFSYLNIWCDKFRNHFCVGKIPCLSSASSNIWNGTKSAVVLEGPFNDDTRKNCIYSHSWLLFFTFRVSAEAHLSKLALSKWELYNTIGSRHSNIMIYCEYLTFFPFMHDFHIFSSPQTFGHFLCLVNKKNVKSRLYGRWAFFLLL